MKSLLSVLCLSTLFLFTGITNSTGQSGSRIRSVISIEDWKNKAQMDLLETGNRKIRISNSRLLTRESQIYKPSGKAVDTLHYPLTGNYALYISGQNGFVTGNNEYGDLAKADFFQSDQEYEVTGILIEFAYAVGGNPNIEVALWDNTGAGNSPGLKKGSATVSLNTIKNDVTNQQMTYIPFNPPVLLATSFYAGVVLPTINGDTLAIWSNTDGETNPGIAWEMWNTGAWIPISSLDSWGVNISQAIFPVVGYDESLNADFTADDVSIVSGQIVSFQDLSNGNPTSWEWTFEGGDPTTSNLQNPVVTYNNLGNYDVTLVVGNDSTTDAEAKQDYISVVESSIEIDTLNYPLAGTYAVYITNLNAYVSGNNEYGDLAKANIFSGDQDRYITGVLIEFAFATGANPNIEIAIWNNSGASGSPGSKLISKNVPLNTIKDDINNQAMTYIEINPPIHVTTSFYAGFMLPTNAGDTLVVWSNTDGNTNPGTAWELWNTNLWYSFDDVTNSWGLNVALAIFPIVQNTLGISDNNEVNPYDVLPNPSSGIFSINTAATANEKVTITVFSSNGFKILEESFNSGENMIIDLSNCREGLYIAKIRTGDRIFFQKLILE